MISAFSRLAKMGAVCCCNDVWEGVAVGRHVVGALQPAVTEEPSVYTAWERSLPVILRYWGRSCTVWVCVCLPLLSVSLLFLQGKQGSRVWGEMSWTFFTAARFSEYKSEAKFCIDFIHSEEPRRESDQIPSGAKIHFKVGEKKLKSFNCCCVPVAPAVSVAISSFWKVFSQALRAWRWAAVLSHVVSVQGRTLPISPWWRRNRKTPVFLERVRFKSG